MNYRSIALAFVGLVVYYSLYTAINPIILGFTGDNSFVEFLTKVIPLVLFFAIIFSAFTGNDPKNYKYSYLLFCGGVFLLFASPVTAGLTDNLIRAYDYQNMSYTDLLGNGADLDMYNFYLGNNGTVSGGVTISDGAMVFDGSGYVEISNAVDYSGEMVIFAWYTHTTQSAGTYPRVFSYGNRILEFWINGDTNTANLLSKDTSVLTTSPLTDGQTYLLIGVKNGADFSFYIDNVLQGNATVGTTSTSTYRFVIGAEGNNLANKYIGQIISAGFFNRDLTETERTEIYNSGKDSYSPISDGLVAQYSGKDFAGTESSPTTIYDTKSFTHDIITNTTRIKFNYSEFTYMFGGDINDFFDDGGIYSTISFFTNTTDTSRYIFNIRIPIPFEDGEFLSHQEFSGALETGIYDDSEHTWVTTNEITTTYNILRNIIIQPNEIALNSEFYYDSELQGTDSNGMQAFTDPYWYIGKWFYGYWSGLHIWDVNNLTDLQIRLINGGWSYNNRHKTGFAVQNIFSEDFYDDYIIQIEDLTTNIKTNYTSTRGAVFVDLDNSTSYNVTAININDDFADLSQEITGTDLEVLFSVYDYNSILINVYDEETKELITENITLKYSNTLTTTLVNDTGSFYLTNLTSGTYQLNLFGDDYLSRYYYVSVVNNANASLNAYLLKTASSLSRAVNVLCGSNPIEDALISFYIAYDPAVYTLVGQRYTDGFGQANFFLNPDTTYRLVIEKGDDIYISSVIPTSTPITVNICQDSDQPYNYTTFKDLFSVLLTPKNTLLDIETTNFTLDVVSSGGYIDSFGIYSTYNSINYSSTLSNSTSGGSVRIEIPISTAQDLINIYWFVNTTDNESYDGFKIYKTKMFTDKGNSSFFQVFEDYDTEFSGYWKYIFITFIAGMFMLLTAKYIPPQYNAFVGLAIFIFFGYLGWIAWAYILPMGAILILYVVVRR